MAAENPAPDEKIVDKIRKLLALATSSNENEAAVAAAKAQDMLLKYNLEMAQIDRASQKKEDPYSHEMDTDITKAEWKVDLAYAVAKANLCTIVMHTVGGTRLDWIGRESNIEVAKFVYFTLSQDLETIAASKWALILGIRQMLERDPNVDIQRIGDAIGLSYQELYDLRNLHGKAWKNSFFLGAVLTIRERLREATTAFQATNTQSNALIVTSGQELTNYVRSLYPRLGHAASRQGSIHSGAYNMGKATGRSIQFRNGIGGGGSGGTKRLGSGR